MRKSFWRPTFWSFHFRPQKVASRAKHRMDPSDCHILVVDDEKISQVVVSSLLRKCNYKGKYAPWATG